MVQQGLDNELDIILGHLFIRFLDVVVHDIVLNEALSENILLLELSVRSITLHGISPWRIRPFKPFFPDFIFLFRPCLHPSCSARPDSPCHLPLRLFCPFPTHRLPWELLLTRRLPSFLLD
jgi:hypothetical protein